MTYTISRDTNIVSVIVTDMVTLQDCVCSVDGLLAEGVLEPGMQLLIDATSIKPELSFSDLHNLVWHVQRLVRGGLSSIAIIATSDFVYGLARTFCTHADLQGFNVGAFRTSQKALMWLESCRPAICSSIRSNTLPGGELP